MDLLNYINNRPAYKYTQCKSASQLNSYNFAQTRNEKRSLRSPDKWTALTLQCKWQADLLHRQKHSQLGHFGCELLRCGLCDLCEHLLAEFAILKNIHANELFRVAPPCL